MILNRGRYLVRATRSGRSKSSKCGAKMLLLSPTKEKGAVSPATELCLKPGDGRRTSPRFAQVKGNLLLVGRRRRLATTRRWREA